MTDREATLEEFESLAAIYGDDATIHDDEGMVEVCIPSRDAEPHAVARATCPSDYPSASPPVVEVAGLPEAVAAEAAAQLEALFVPGEVVLFSWLEWLRERHERWREDEQAQERLREAADAEPAGAAAAALAAARLGGGSSGTGSEEEEEEEEGREEASLAAAAARRDQRAAARAEDAALMAAVAPRIVSGEPRTERRSTFQAHVARVGDPREVAAVIAVLLQNNKIANATHPAIMAYRISTPRPGVFLQDCDDDGEDAAGGRLLHLLQLSGAADVAVVVSRWFGGVLLGPSRFALINNTARELLVREGFIKAAPGGGGGGGGKKKGKGR